MTVTRPLARLLAPALTTSGLLAGYGAARATGVRALGGVVLAAFGAGAFVVVQRAAGPVRAGTLTVAYLAAFGGSHPLAKRLGAWPSVLAVAAATAVVAAAATG
ncbi:hypothetical protein [Amnibacterium sp.]|uniref:hypothetical protein n=1 Tax=Amnibacterium sp. TaxID=1872496 RepID=UPI002601FEF8|nr:hypothetical protein [Amnibacterium sp.]MCU1473108.1 hypothetical protein [Amnibacterium sp.]